MVISNSADTIERKRGGTTSQVSLSCFYLLTGVDFYSRLPSLSICLTANLPVLALMLALKMSPLER